MTVQQLIDLLAPLQRDAEIEATYDVGTASGEITGVEDDWYSTNVEKKLRYNIVVD